MSEAQAIAKFVEAVKLDRHDWEDWPKDSREAFVALQAAQPDCRTCWHYAGLDGCWNVKGCTNGDKYIEAPRVVLWRTE
jgi:hypothetical protein